jgi:ribonuclease PH
MKAGAIEKSPIKDCLAAVSVGMVSGDPRLDLCYAEDSGADVDMNVVMTGSGGIVEIQGTAEAAPFSREMLDAQLVLAQKGISQLVEIQREILESNMLKYQTGIQRA